MYDVLGLGFESAELYLIALIGRPNFDLAQPVTHQQYEETSQHRGAEVKRPNRNEGPLLRASEPLTRPKTCHTQHQIEDQPARSTIHNEVEECADKHGRKQSEDGRW
jgi:hypothetical protein